MLLYQILENIGAMTGLMPLTGITLPFISYGGTSLLINMACMGIAMSVRLYGQDVEDDLPLPQPDTKGKSLCPKTRCFRLYFMNNRLLGLQSLIPGHTGNIRGSEGEGLRKMEDVKLERGDSLRITFKYTAILICFL